MSTKEKFLNRLQLVKEFLLRKPKRQADPTPCEFETDKNWLNLQFINNHQIKKPDELENGIVDPPGPIDEKILDKIQGSLIGLALGDALGAHVEFRPRQYLLANPVNTLEGGGTWGLKQGQFTDDTSMALCLAISLVARRNFVPYDQLVRYKWWYLYGYMSSTGKCFDIGAATRQSLDVFIRRQDAFAKKRKIPVEKLDYLSDPLLQKFDVYCSTQDVAGNGALMRLAPVPLFFYKYPEEAVEFSGYSGQITHGDKKAYDACRYYGALICAALHNCGKDELLDKSFYENHERWFGDKPLCDEIRAIAEGSYQRKGGYEDGIRGKGYIVNALEAALWAFWSDDNSFEKGVLAAVNLGDDTDTTAAIYGQLAGAYYGYKNLPKKWVEQVYAKKFIEQLSKWIAYEGENWKGTEVILAPNQYTVGGVHSDSVDDLTSDKPAMSYSQLRPRISSETFPSQRNREYDRSAPSAMGLQTSSASTQNPLSDNDRISDQHVPSQLHYNDTITSNGPGNPISNEEQRLNKNSTPKSQRKKT